MYTILSTLDVKNLTCEHISQISMINGHLNAEGNQKSIVIDYENRLKAIARDKRLQCFISNR